MAQPVIMFVFDGDVAWFAPDTPSEEMDTVAMLCEDACYDQEYTRELKEYEEGDIIALHSYKADSTMMIEWEAEGPEDVYRFK